MAEYKIKSIKQQLHPREAKVLKCKYQPHTLIIICALSLIEIAQGKTCIYIYAHGEFTARALSAGEKGKAGAMGSDLRKKSN